MKDDDVANARLRGSIRALKRELRERADLKAGFARARGALVREVDTVVGRATVEDLTALGRAQMGL